MADRDRTIASMSGFGLVKPTTPRPAITFVPAPLVSAGVNAGALDAKLRKVKSAVTYHYFITSNSTLPIEEWARFESTQFKFHFNDLASATRYYVRVAAVGINEPLVFATCIVTLLNKIHHRIHPAKQPAIVGYFGI